MSKEEEDEVVKKIERVFDISPSRCFLCLNFVSLFFYSILLLFHIFLCLLYLSLSKHSYFMKAICFYFCYYVFLSTLTHDDQN